MCEVLHAVQAHATHAVMHTILPMLDPTAMDANVPIRDAFKIADDVLRQGVKGISEIITVRQVHG